MNVNPRHIVEVCGLLAAIGAGCWLVLLPDAGHIDMPERVQNHRIPIELDAEDWCENIEGVRTCRTANWRNIFARYNIAPGVQTATLLHYGGGECASRDLSYPVPGSVEIIIPSGDEGAEMGEC